MDGALVTVHLVRWVRLVRYGRYVLRAWYGMVGTVQEALYQAGKKPYHRTVPIQPYEVKGRTSLRTNEISLLVRKGGPP